MTGYWNVFILLKWYVLFLSKYLWWENLRGSFQFVSRKNCFSLLRHIQVFWRAVYVWWPGRCRWLGISWCKAICSFWVWCGAKPFTTFGGYIVLRWVFWRLWMFGGLVDADGLAYLDARPSAASEFDVVPSHLQPLVVIMYWDGYFGGCECLAAW